MSRDRMLPSEPDVRALFGAEPEIGPDRAPNPVEWWAASNGAAVSVLVMDFATGALYPVSLPADGSPRRLFQQGMTVREPFLYNLSAVAFDFAFRSDIAYNDGRPAMRVPAGQVWTKYGLSAVNAGALLATFTDLADNADGQAVSATALDILTLARLEGFNGATYDRIRTAQALDAGTSVGVVAAHDAKAVVAAAATVAAQVITSLLTATLAFFRGVSAANTAQVVIIDLRNLATALDIISVASATTANLTVEVSVDNANWTTIDTLAAAATQAKHYTATTVGATVAVSPLAFRYVRITAGTAGVGNTTTLTVTAK